MERDSALRCPRPRGGSGTNYARIHALPHAIRRLALRSATRRTAQRCRPYLILEFGFKPEGVNQAASPRVGSIFYDTDGSSEGNQDGLDLKTSFLPNSSRRLFITTTTVLPSWPMTPRVSGIFPSRAITTNTATVPRERTRF